MLRHLALALADAPCDRARSATLRRSHDIMARALDSGRRLLDVPVDAVELVAR